MRRFDRQNRPGDQETLQPGAAFAEAFGNLPDEVWLWSGRNLYDVTLGRSGGARHGSFRLNAADRARNALAFMLHGEAGPDGRRGWRFGRRQGVRVTKVRPLVYVVHYNGKAVVFRLNTHTSKAPGEVRIRGGETYLGAVEDETGTGFFRIWQGEAGIYFYTLDENRLTESLQPLAVSDQIRIGERSGFVFYRDRYMPRWILIGVRKEDACRDRLYDGPFDPKTAATFSGGTFIRAPGPRGVGPEDQKGHSEKSSGPMAGVLVRPYMLYKSYHELDKFDQCVARAVDPATYYLCFVPAPAP